MALPAHTPGQPRRRAQAPGAIFSSVALSSAGSFIAVGSGSAAAVGSGEFQSIPEKWTFKANEVSYMGHLLTANGLKPDLENVAAISNMHRPQNRTELQQYLGMVTYLGKFLPQLSDITAPLRPLGKDSRMMLGRSSSKEF